MPYFPASAEYTLPWRAVAMRQKAEAARAATVVDGARVGVPPVARIKPRVVSSALSQHDYGAQGGDPSRGVEIDLSTCVNRYGPAPAAIEALRSIEPADIVMHPYDAAERLVDLYRWATGTSGGAMIAGRGASEFIWAMGREIEHEGVQIPLPAYTDYLKAFPGRGFTLDGEQIPTIDQIRGALANGKLVIISNPHNPTGTRLDAAELIAAAQAYPDSTLVVDESYVNFTPDPIGNSVIGCDAPNVVVLRSTSKFYGIAATRAGIAWCAEPERLRHLFGRQENWGLSGVDVRVASAAVRDFHWSTHTRVQMHADNAWLGRALSDMPSVEPCLNTNVHFQYAFSRNADDIAQTFRRHGIGVRVLSAAHGVHPDALRIVAPREDERDRFIRAVVDLAAKS